MSKNWFQARRCRPAYWLPALIASAVLCNPNPSRGDDRPVILFVGTSLTAGFGLASDEAYPALIQGELETHGYRHRVVNAGVSGDTSAGGLRRID